jgi:hypothetical protein
MNWDEKKDKNGNIVVFHDKPFLDDWWNNLNTRQKSDAYHLYCGEDPIEGWRKG